MTDITPTSNIPAGGDAPESASMKDGWHIGKRALIWMLLITLAGMSLRIFGPPALKRSGYDEVLYMGYIGMIDRASYPRIVQAYIEDQKTTDTTKLPPTRFLYIFLGYSWRNTFGQPALESLHAISCLFSILMIPLAAVFAFRLGGERIAVGVTALTAFSPMQIYVSRHALIDGFFGFWAVLCLWLLWENLRNPGSFVWLATYTIGLALAVMTKENSFFLFAAFVGIAAINPWAKFGKVTLPLVLCTIGGGALGVGVLAALSGGVEPFMEVYLVLMKSASHFPYSIKTGDGPWYRYLYDLMLMSPFILLLAIGAVFQVTREKKAQLFLVSFIGFSYLIMCNVKYGMNLRYANMWDMPLRYLAFCQFAMICDHAGRRKTLVLVLGMAALCAYDLRQYYIFFVQGRLYELVTGALAFTLHIIK
ncbi:MAG: phospholipid carrier-dependent glycosyltransferase [Chthoniobacteraceae bacterium]